MTGAENITHTAPSATNSTGEMLAARADGRFAAEFVNDGTSTIWLAIGVAAVANIGIPLLAGSSFWMGPPYNNLSPLAVNGITASATVVCAVTEWYDT